MNKDLQKKIFAIIVTYGNRWHLLEQAIKACLDDGVSKVIVVSNGALLDISSLAVQKFGINVHVITLPSNTGSAGGFNVGFRYAIESNPDYVLLLDDDNQVHLGTVKSLLSLYAQEVLTASIDNLAIMSIRQSRFNDSSNQVIASKINARPESYFNFHIFDIPFKIFKRISWIKNYLSTENDQSSVILNVAPWSGLFFHISLIKKLGLPNPDFILYADDTEYTMRIAKSGGKIVLCSGARITDLDQSWNLSGNFSNQFDGLLLGNGDFRAYYSTRNNHYLEFYCKTDNGFLHKINRWTFMLILTARAIILNKRGRLNLLLQAMKDGKNKQLGINENFPL